MNKKARLCAAFEFPAAILTLSVSIIFVLSLFLSLSLLLKQVAVQTATVFSKNKPTLSRRNDVNFSTKGPNRPGASEEIKRE